MIDKAQVASSRQVLTKEGALDPGPVQSITLRIDFPDAAAIRTSQDGAIRNARPDTIAHILAAKIGHLLPYAKVSVGDDGLSQRASENSGDGIIILHQVVKVRNAESFLDYTGEIDKPEADRASIQKLLEDHLFVPEGDPEKMGFRLSGVESHEYSDGLFRISAVVETLDTDEIDHAACDAHEAAWQDAHWTPRSTEHALWEILVASNALPSPDTIGLELDRAYVVDTKFVRASAGEILALKKGYGMHPDVVIVHVDDAATLNTEVGHQDADADGFQP